MNILPRPDGTSQRSSIDDVFAVMLHFFCYSNSHSQPCWWQQLYLRFDQHYVWEKLGHTGGRYEV